MEKRLLLLAGLFLLTCTLALTLAPAVRAGALAALVGQLVWLPWGVFGVWLGMTCLVYSQIQRSLPGHDAYLLPGAALLSGWGMLMISRLYPAFGLRQALWYAICAGLVWAALCHPDWLRRALDSLPRHKTVWLVSGLALTGLTLVFGSNPQGAGPNLWLGWGEVYFQPSEPLKLLLVVYLAAYLAEQDSAPATHNRAAFLSQLVQLFVLTVLSAALLLVQRDLGTLSVFLFLYALMLYLATGRKRVIVFSAVFLLAAGMGGYALFDVVRLRVDAWLNPWQDPSGRSYQVVQSLMAVANGGVLGRGIGLGHPRLVPVAHSDFIFAALAEEFGMLGGVAALAVYALLVQRGLRAAQRAASAFQMYAAAGISALVGVQAIVIIGGNLRLLPLTGITLPLMSYGGSSLLTSFVELLILLYVSATPPAAQREPGAAARRIPAIFVLLLAGFTALAGLSLWWGVLRAPALLERTDNARRSLADLYVRRGSVLARSHAPLTHTDVSGGAGNFSRVYDYPPLAPVLGYTHAVYGQAGLEAALDGYLRGVRGAPAWLVWQQHVLTGYPPPGLDVRLSVHLPCQRDADSRMAQQRGALILMDAHSGEILALVSQPGYDPNRLEQDWRWLIHAPDFPLLNRPLLGRYAFPAAQEGTPTLAQALADLTAQEDGEQRRASPLDVAMLAAVLNNGGVSPAPRLALAFQTPQSGWQEIPAQDDPVYRQPFSLAPTTVKQILSTAHQEQGRWEISLETHEESAHFVWVLAGTLPPQEHSLALALVLEDGTRLQAQQIGRALLQAAGR